jgi:hypothetical protein
MRELVDTLLRQTRAGAIRWRPTDLPGAYLYANSSGSVVVERDGPASPTRIQILDARGDQVETYEAQRAGGLSTVLSRDGLIRSGFRELDDLASEIAKRYTEGNPLLDAIRREAEVGQPA